MNRIGPANSRSLAVVDPAGRAVADPSTNVIGVQRGAFNAGRVVWANPFGQSGLKRYLPDHPPTEACAFAMDFSFVIPFGVGIASGSLAMFTNTANPAASADWTIGPVVVWGRTLYAQLTGGVPGTDYQLRWTATDTAGNVWPRTALCLCAQTS